MSAASRPHIVLLGTGLTSLTLARALLQHTPPLSIRLTLIDKARNPGGRLTSRTYDSGVTLETGLRVFESPLTNKEGGEGAFGREVESWERNGWVQEVKREKLKGATLGKWRWWEASGGVTKGLVDSLVSEIKAASEGRLDMHFEETAGNPSPSSTSPPYMLALDPSPPSLSPADILVITAPSPQTALLLPKSDSAPSTTQYLKTFTLLLPSIDVPSLPVYWRDPHPALNSIATGLAPDSTSSAGLVIQSTPEKLNLPYAKDESSDEQVKAAFLRVLRESEALSEDVIGQIGAKKGRESQIKRWKFAQVEHVTDDSRGASADSGEKPYQILGGDDSRVLIAGDGTAGGKGGVEGAWRAAMGAKERILEWLKEGETAGKL